MRTTFQPAFLLMSGRSLGFVATFIVPLVLVRVFDQSEFGTYKQIFLIYSTLYGVAQLGMAESLFYFLPLAPYRGGNYVLNSLLISAGSGLACLAILAIIAGDVGRWFGNPEISRHLSLLGIYLGLTLASTALEIAMVARQNYLVASLTYAISDAARTALLVVPVFLHWQLRGLLLGAIAFAALRLCATVLYFRREFDSGLRPDAYALRQQVAYALPFQVAVLLEILQANFPHYAVAHRFDAATFAIYSVGCLQIPLVDFVATSVGNVLMVRMGEEIRDGRKDGVLALWQDTTRKLALIFFPLVGLLLLSAREIIVLLFTESYAGSVPLFALWSTVILLSALPTNAVMRTYADTRVLVILNMARLLLIAAFVPWFLSSYHLLGAVLIAVAAAALAKALALLRVKSLIRAPLSQLLPWRHLGTILGCASIACAPGLLLKWQAGIPTLPLLLGVGLLYATTYVGLLCGFGQLNVRELLAVRLPLRDSPAEAVEVGEPGTG